MNGLWSTLVRGHSPQQKQRLDVKESESWRFPFLTPKTHGILDLKPGLRQCETIFTTSDSIRVGGIVGVTVRRERRWTSAGETPARELVRSTR